MRFMKRELMSAIINSEIVKYVMDECLANIKKKKSKLKGAKMIELRTLKLVVKKTAF